MDSRSPAPEPYLDANNQISVGVGNFHGCFGVHQPQLFTFAEHDAIGKPEYPGVQNVQIGEYSNNGSFDDMLAEAGKIAGSRRTSVNCRGDGTFAAEVLRINAKRSASPVNMRMHVNEAGSYDKA